MKQGNWKPRAYEASPSRNKAPWQPRQRRSRQSRWTYEGVRIAALLAVFLGVGGYQFLTKDSLDMKPLPFRNCAAARAAGPTPIFRDHPRWANHLDADGDGRACEPMPR
jgi:hypothetical protein